MSFVSGNRPVISSVGPGTAKNLSADAAPVMVRENEGRLAGRGFAAKIKELADTADRACTNAARVSRGVLLQGSQPRADASLSFAIGSLSLRPRPNAAAEAPQQAAAAPVPLHQRTPYARPTVSVVNEARFRAIDGSLSVLRQNTAVVKRRLSVLDADRKTYQTTEPDEATRQKISRRLAQCKESVEDLHGLADLIREQQVICEQASFSS